MSQSNFFIERSKSKDSESKFSPQMRTLIVTAISVTYGVVAVFIASVFLELRGMPLFGVAIIYAYGILGGLAILMLIRIFTSSEENKKMLLDVLDYDSSPHAITDESGKYLYTNKAWRALFGSPKSVSYQDISSVFIRPHNLQQKLQVYQSQKSMEITEPFVFLDQNKNQSKWLELTLYTLPEWKNYKQWHIRDMTHEYQLEETSKEHYDDCNNLLNNTSLSFLITDTNGTIVFNNNALLELANVHKDEAKKIVFHDLFIDSSKEDGSAPYSLYTDNRSQQDGRYILQTKDGSQKNVFLIHNIKTEENGDIFAYSVIYDLDANTKPDLSPKDGNETHFQDVFMDAPLGICIIQPDLMISSYNGAFKSMTGQSNIDNITLSALIIKEQHETLQQWLDSILNDDSNGVPSLEINLLQSKGQLPTRVYAHKLEDNQLALYFVDLTEQKNLEQQFTQSQKMQGIGQLAGGIAHDFNNLLTAMIGFCDLLLLRHKPGDPSFADIMQIKQNANRAANLVRQLLAFSRQQTLQPEVLDITDVLSDLLHLMQRLIGANINLNIKHGQNLWAVKSDEGQLEQVLINLVVNARDAMKEGGNLDIVTDNYKNDTLESLNEDEYLPPGEWVSIKVSDTGTGIEPDVLSRIFEPFFSTKEIGAGTGLGLSTVHGIVHQTDGFLAVESIVGEGTSFTIYLPRYEQTENDETIVDSKETLQETEESTEDLTGSAAILLVEDEDAVRIFSSRALSNKGYKIIDAANGELAMEIIEKDEVSIELLITDVIMPEMDGPTLAKHARRLHPDLKIIFMSGYSEDRFKEEFGKNTYFLQKPFTLKQLAKMVKDVIEGE